MVFDGCFHRKNKEGTVWPQDDLSYILIQSAAYVMDMSAAKKSGLDTVEPQWPQPLAAWVTGRSTVVQ